MSIAGRFLRSWAGSRVGRTHKDAVHAAWLVSVQSLAWSASASSAAVVLGATSHTLALVALGAVGYVDGIGSAALTYHFHHARRHDQLSERIEHIAHRVVVVGLLTVGLVTSAVSAMRLVTSQAGGSSLAGTVLAAISLVALLGLSLRKQVIARILPSPALLTDGHLSGIGALQAAVALAGVASASWFSWDWADASAALLVGGIAIALAVSTWIHDLGPMRQR
jgi:divalent metal cation (Fe/Co/Zn/Cd) transporter